jgi:small subunit ribosomal protein S2
VFPQGNPPEWRINPNKEFKLIMPVVSLAQMMEAGVHFGHQTRRWNPRMDQYIYTARNGVHIIDLVQTAQLMEEAYSYMRTAAEQGKRCLFVGTKRQAAGIIAQEASRCGAYYVNQRWLGGMLTNWETIKGRVERLKELERREESGALDLLPKKEAAVLRRELGKLQKYLGGIKMMRRIPDIVVIIDQRREYNAIKECEKLSIPVVSMLDTNCDPDVVDIPIPANDDAIRSIKLIIGKLADAIYEGRHGELETEDEQEFAEALDEMEDEYSEEDMDSFESDMEEEGEDSAEEGEDSAEEGEDSEE